jgi:hypothetical protein
VQASDVAAGRGQSRHRGVASRIVDVEDGDVGAVRGQDFGVAKADARRAGRHDGRQTLDLEQFARLHAFPLFAATIGPRDGRVSE